MTRSKLKVGDRAKIGKLTEWGVVQEHAGKTGEVLRRAGCPPGFALVNVSGVGERYIATKRMTLVEAPR